MAKTEQLEQLPFFLHDALRTQAAQNGRILPAETVYGQQAYALPHRAAEQRRIQYTEEARARQQG
jgi:hypothetical protein